MQAMPNGLVRSGVDEHGVAGIELSSPPVDALGLEMIRDLDEAPVEARLDAGCFERADAAEGIGAYNEEREPVFRGH